MDKSLDGLVAYVIDRVAVTGDIGISPKEFVALVQGYYRVDAGQDADQHEQAIGSSEDDSEGPNLDNSFLEFVWRWLADEPDIRIGNRGQFQNITLAEAEAAQPSQNQSARPATNDGDRGTTHDNGNAQIAGAEGLVASNTLLLPPHSEAPSQVVEESNRPGIQSRGPQQAKSSKPGAKSKQPSPQNQIRIFASDALIWPALTGHGPDPQRVKPLDFTILSIIAARGAKGILQNELVRISGQDKRSVPHRTDRLQEAGYITKEQIMVLVRDDAFDKKLNTSLCTLDRFAQDPEHVREVQRLVDETKEKTYLKNKARTKRNRIVRKAVEDAAEEAPPDDNEIEDENDFIAQWTAERSTANEVLRVIEESGTSGSTLPDLRRLLWGDEWKKPIEFLTGRLVDAWQISQPLHLRHLAIVRDTMLKGKSPVYVHYSFSNYQRRVLEGVTSWEAVTTLPKRVELSPHVSASLDAQAWIDENGFPQLQDSLFEGGSGFAPLADCATKSQRAKQFPRQKRGSGTPATPRMHDRNMQQTARSVDPKPASMHRPTPSPASMHLTSPPLFDPQDFSAEFAERIKELVRYLPTTATKGRGRARQFKSFTLPPNAESLTYKELETFHKTWKGSERYQLTKIEKEIDYRIERGDTGANAAADILDAIDAAKLAGDADQFAPTIRARIMFKYADGQAPGLAEIDKAIGKLKTSLPRPLAFKKRVTLPFDFEKTYMPSIAAHTLRIPMYGALSSTIGKVDYPRAGSSARRDVGQRQRKRPQHLSDAVLDIDESLIASEASQNDEEASVTRAMPVRKAVGSADSGAPKRRGRPKKQPPVGSEVMHFTPLQHQHAAKRSFYVDIGARKRRSSALEAIDSAGAKRQRLDEARVQYLPSIAAHSGSFLPYVQRMPGPPSPSISAGISASPEPYRKEPFQARVPISLQAALNRRFEEQIQALKSTTQGIFFAKTTTLKRRHDEPHGMPSTRFQVMVVRLEGLKGLLATLVDKETVSLVNLDPTSLASASQQKRSYNENITEVSNIGPQLSPLVTRHPPDVIPFDQGPARLTTFSPPGSVQYIHNDTSTSRILAADENTPVSFATKSQSLNTPDVRPPILGPNPIVGQSGVSGSYDTVSNLLTGPQDEHYQSENRTPQAGNSPPRPVVHSGAHDEDTSVADLLLEPEGGRLSRLATPTNQDEDPHAPGHENRHQTQPSQDFMDLGISQNILDSTDDDANSSDKSVDQNEESRPSLWVCLRSHPAQQLPNTVRGRSGELETPHRTQIDDSLLRSSGPTPAAPSTSVLDNGRKYNDDLSKIRIGRLARTGGSTAILRKSIVMDLVERAGGVCPGPRELTLPFTEEWNKRGNTGQPEITTVKATVNALCSAGKLQVHTFAYQTSEGLSKTKSTLRLPHVDANDPKIKQVQDAMIQAGQRNYIPTEWLFEAGEGEAGVSASRAQRTKDLPIKNTDNLARLDHHRHNVQKLKRAEELEKVRQKERLVTLRQLLGASKERKRRVRIAGVLQDPPITEQMIRKRKMEALTRKRRPSILPKGFKTLQIQGTFASQIVQHPYKTTWTERPLGMRRKRSARKVIGPYRIPWRPPRSLTRPKQQETESTMPNPNQLRIARSPSPGDRSSDESDFEGGAETAVMETSASISRIMPIIPEKSSRQPNREPLKVKKHSSSKRPQSQNLPKVFGGRNRKSAQKKYLPTPPIIQRLDDPGVKPRKPARPAKRVKVTVPKRPKRKGFYTGIIPSFMDPRQIFHVPSGTFAAPFTGLTKVIISARVNTNITKAVEAYNGTSMLERDPDDPTLERSIYSIAMKTKFAVEADKLLRWELTIPGVEHLRYPRWLFLHYLFPHHHKSAVDENLFIDRVIFYKIDARTNRLVAPRIHTGTEHGESSDVAPVLSDIDDDDDHDENDDDEEELQTSRKRHHEDTTTTESSGESDVELVFEDQGRSIMTIAGRRRVLKRRKRSHYNAQFTQEEELRFQIAVIAVRSITGGIEKRCNWLLIAQAFGEQRETRLFKYKWKYLQEKLGSDLPSIEEDFQQAFAKAYEEGGVPALDFAQLTAFPWKWLVDWYIELQAQPKSIGDLPADRSLLSIHEASPDAFEDHMNQYYGLEGANTIATRKNALNRQAWTQPLVLERVTSAEKPSADAFAIAMTWVRANISTFEEDYDPSRARIALNRFTNETIERALEVLLKEKVVTQNNKGRLAPGRLYSLHEGTLTRLLKPITAVDLKRAASFKAYLDLQLASHDEVEWSWHAQNGEAIVAFNLVARNRVTLRTKDVPNNKWGFTGDGYETRQMDKSKLYSKSVIMANDEYVRGNPILPLPEPKGKPDTEAAEMMKIPLWYDIHGNVVQYLWEICVSAVLCVVATRPSISVEDLRRCVHPVLETWEVELIMEWAVEAGIGEQIVDAWGKRYEVKEWWWMALSTGEEDGEEFARDELWPALRVLELE